MEVVVPGCHWDGRGVSAFDCLSWADGRRVWNDYTYHVTNINEDGTVPVHQTRSWLTDNSYLAQENRCVLCPVEVQDDWVIEVVDQGTSGPYNAIALWYDTNSNPYPHISYRVDEGTGKGLWHAWKHPDSSCRLNPGWSLLPLDTLEDGRGAWTSIAIEQFTDPIGSRVHVSFTDTVSGERKIFNSTHVLCSLKVAVDTVDDKGTLGTFGTDLALKDSCICIVYYDAGNGDLKYAEKNVVSGGSWQIVSLDVSGDVGKYPAIAISNGVHHVSYYDATNGDLKYAQCHPAYGPCTLPPTNPESGWFIVQAVDTAGVVGLFTEIAFDENNDPYISYIDSTNQALKCAFYVLGWTIVTVDSVNNFVASTSIGIGSENSIHVSYSDRTDRTLKCASCSSGCGYSSNWDKATVPDSWSDVGFWNSIAVDPADTVHISYSASDSLCSFKALKYAKGKR